MGTVKDSRIEARVSSEMKADFVRMAHLEGLTLSEYLIMCAQSETLRRLKKHTSEKRVQIDLSREDSLALAEIIMAQKPANKALLKAFEKHKARYQE